MEKKISGERRGARSDDRYKHCSDLFRYLVKRYADLQAEGYGTRNGPAWGKLVAKATKDGQTRASGEPLTVEAVRKVFVRVGRTLAEEERQQRAGGAPKRQEVPRAPVGWQPPVARAPETTVARPHAAPMNAPAANNERAPFAQSPPSTGITDRSRMTPEERMADLRRVIDRRSGR